MTSKWLQAETSADGKTLHLKCHLDTSKVLPDGSPDPLYVRELEYTLSPAFSARRALAEAELLMAETRKRLAPVRTPLAEVGKVF